MPTRTKLTGAVVISAKRDGVGTGGKTGQGFSLALSLPLSHRAKVVSVIFVALSVCTGKFKGRLLFWRFRSFIRNARSREREIASDEETLHE